jgi:hypothetical protein
MNWIEIITLRANEARWIRVLPQIMLVAPKKGGETREMVRKV